MKRFPMPFGYYEPKTVEEAINILSMCGTNAKVLAGGTDLLVSMKRKEISPQYVVYIKSIPELDFIEYSPEAGLKIGAVATHAAIADLPIIRGKFDFLATACNKIGTPQVRNMGTIGGNICQGGPSQDTIPSLLVLDAKLKLVGPNGERLIPIEEFFIAPFQTALNEAELLIEIQIPPLPPQTAGCYKWITKRSKVDETLVGVAVLMMFNPIKDICKDIRIGLCSVGPTPFRARRAEELLRGEKVENKLLEQVAKIAAEETRSRSRADYRRNMTKVLVKGAIDEVLEKING
jgi:CO/xanthine dehydrogenase FAD-binding subunit